MIEKILTVLSETGRSVFTATSRTYAPFSSIPGLESRSTELRLIGGSETAIASASTAEVQSVCLTSIPEMSEGVLSLVSGSVGCSAGI